MAPVGSVEIVAWLISLPKGHYKINNTIYLITGCLLAIDDKLLHNNIISLMFCRHNEIEMALQTSYQLTVLLFKLAL